MPAGAGVVQVAAFHAELCACIVQDPSAKRSKLISDAPSLPATWQSTCMDSYADSLSSVTKSDAEQEAQPGITPESTATHAWRTKENRSPNFTMLQQLQGDLDLFVEGQQIADQVTHATSTLLFQHCSSLKCVCCPTVDMHGTTQPQGCVIQV